MIVDSAHYKDGERQHEGPMSLEEAARRPRDVPGEFVWIGRTSPSRVSSSGCRSLFGLHELAVEDAGLEHQRPKIEDYDDPYFIVLKTAHYHEKEEIVHFGEISVFAGPGYVVAVRRGPGSELKTARARLEERPDLLKLGARLGGVGDPRQGGGRLHPGRRRDRGRHRGGRERRLRRRHPRARPSASTT